MKLLSFVQTGQWVGKGSHEWVTVEGVDSELLDVCEEVTIEYKTEKLERYDSGDMMGYNYVTTPMITLKKKKQ